MLYVDDGRYLLGIDKESLKETGDGSVSPDYGNMSQIVFCEVR